MNRATKPMRELAQHVITVESAGNISPEGTVAAAFSVCEKFRDPLSTLMGAGGFSALMGRTVAVAATEMPWLKGVSVAQDGTLAGFNASEMRGNAKDFSEGALVLVAQLLGLLVAFIGEDLTFRLVRELWPGVSPEGIDLQQGN